jgi:hypothetical protein
MRKVATLAILPVTGSWRTTGTLCIIEIRGCLKHTGVVYPKSWRVLDHTLYVGWNNTCYQEVET